MDICIALISVSASSAYILVLLASLGLFSNLVMITRRTVNRRNGVCWMRYWVYKVEQADQIEQASPRLGKIQGSQVAARDCLGGVDSSAW